MAEDMMAALAAMQEGYDSASDTNDDYTPPEGDHDCVLQKVNTGFSKKKGEPWVRLDLQIVSNDPNTKDQVVGAFLMPNQPRGMGLLKRFGAIYAGEIPADPGACLSTLQDEAGSDEGDKRVLTVQVSHWKGESSSGFNVAPLSISE